jgi:hypothetical protein
VGDQREFFLLAVSSPVAAARLFAQTVQLCRIRNGQRLHDHGIHQGEYRSCGADAQRQREDRGDGERGSLAQTPQGVAHVLKEGFEKRQSALIAILFPDRLHGAELEYGLASRFIGRKTGAEILRGLHGDMLFDLLAQALLVLPGFRPGDQALHESP